MCAALTCMAYAICSSSVMLLRSLCPAPALATGSPESMLMARARCSSASWNRRLD